jgi:hypothetical protein
VIAGIFVLSPALGESQLYWRMLDVIMSKLQLRPKLPSP